MIKKLTGLYIFCTIIFSSCEKDKLNEPLNNTGIDEDKVESLFYKDIFTVDSSKTSPGMGSAYKTLKVYFHINYKYIRDTSLINNVVLYKNDNTASHLNPSIRTWFGDGMALKGTTYKVEFALRNKKMNISEKSKVFSFTIPF